MEQLKRFYPNQVNQAIAYARSLQKSKISKFRLIVWEESRLTGKDRINEIKEWQGLNFHSHNFTFRSIPYNTSVKYFTVELIED